MKKIEKFPLETSMLALESLQRKRGKKDNFDLSCGNFFLENVQQNVNIGNKWGHLRASDSYKLVFVPSNREEIYLSLWSVDSRKCWDTYQNHIQHNDTQHNDIWHNDTQHNNT